MKLARPQVSHSVLALSTLWLAAPALLPPAGNVLLVDDDGSAPFATIQAAVDAAQDGDVVLVRPGNYAGFRIADKALVVVGDLGAEVRVQGGIRVVDLAAAKTVVLANLSSTGAASLEPELSSGLDLANDAGHVRVEACVLAGGYFYAHGARVRGCADVTLVGCDLRAGPSVGFYPTDADGIAALESSRVTIYGSAVRGGDGPPSSCTQLLGNSGGDGGDVRSAFLFAGNSSFRGGRGGGKEGGSIWACPTAGDGGDGIAAWSASVLVFDTATVEGLGGLELPSNCGSCAYLGYAGLARSGGSFTDLVGDARLLSSQTPAYAGTTTTLTLGGSPGDQIALLISGTAATAEFVPNWHGMLLVPRPRPDGTTRVLLAGAIPASGTLGVPLALPPLASARTIFVQALFRDLQGRFYLSGARSLTVLP